MSLPEDDPKFEVQTFSLEEVEDARKKAQNTILNNMINVLEKEKATPEDGSMDFNEGMDYAFQISIDKLKEGISE